MPDCIERRKAAEIVCDIVCGKDKGLCVSTLDKCQQGHIRRLYEIPAASVLVCEDEPSDMTTEKWDWLMRRFMKGDRDG